MCQKLHYGCSPRRHLQDIHCPDSECLVDAAVGYTRSAAFDTQALSCLDLGTGSGCLLLSLLSTLPNSQE